MEILAKIENVGAQINAEIQDVGLNVNVTVDGRNGYNIGDGLQIDRATNTISVDKAETVAEGDDRPVTAGAVKQYVSERVPDSVSSTEIGYLDGLIDNVQVQISQKLNRNIRFSASEGNTFSMLFQNNDGTTYGAIGGYANYGVGNKLYLGFGNVPYKANPGLAVTPTDLLFNNSSIIKRLEALESATLATMLEGGSADVL